MTDDQSGRYRRAAHAVQTATKMLANLIYGEASKDYVDNRTGLNIQMAEFGGLLDLLVRKGVITELERDETLIAALENEVQRHKVWIAEKMGGAATADGLSVEGY